MATHLSEKHEEVHPQGTLYTIGKIAGKNGPMLVAVAQIGMGGLSAATETERAISYLQPQLSLFVGIAGGMKDVQIGDVVIADKVYAYEVGKVTQTRTTRTSSGQRVPGQAIFEPRPNRWHPSHMLEQRARHEALGNGWLSHLPVDHPDHSPRVHIGSLAAGEKVLAAQNSDLYRFLKATYGDALAVEMEGHGFMQALQSNHDIHGLVIRGISDRIVGKKVADKSGSQQRAACNAAAFVIQLLSQIILPTRPVFPLTSISSLLNLPFPRNPYFTGREFELQVLHTRLTQQQSVAIGQTSAISGLGGIGKTRLAIEYAYRHHSEYQQVFWAQADSVESLVSSYSEIARLLNLPEKDSQEQDSITQAIKRWLQYQSGWLLILDNVDSPELLPAFLPPTVGGHLLITTRVADLSSHLANLAPPLSVESFTDEQGALLLLHRSGLLAIDVPFHQADGSTQMRAIAIAHELGGLPLAIDQAGAYLAATGCGLVTYQQIYRDRRSELLKERRNPDHPEPVATTWEISFRKVEQNNPAAADLLRFCSFLAPEAIPEELITKGVSDLGPVLAAVVVDPFLFNAAIENLLAYSLIRRDPHARTLTVHRLVQAVIRDSMNIHMQQLWIERAINVISSEYSLDSDPS
jgi:nucleoside phosphorylase